MDPFCALPKDIQIPFLKTKQDKAKTDLSASLQILLAIVWQLESLIRTFVEHNVDLYRSNGISGGF